MDLYQLRYFVVLAEELSFTRAAASCHVSQQALSRAVAKLEHHVGVRLIDRTPRGCSLTWAGRGLIPEARELLARAERIRTTFAGGDRIGRRFVVGVHDWGIAELTPILCAAFRERHPDVRLVVQNVASSELPDAIGNREVDALFCLGDAVSDRARFTPLFDDQPVLLTRIADADGGAPLLAAADVLDRVYVAAADYMSDRYYAPYSLGSLRNGEPARQIGLPAPDTLADLTRQIVDAGAVIATNSIFARHVAAAPGAVYIPLTGAPPFTFGVASGPSAGELQDSLVDLARGVARADLDVIAVDRPIAL